MMSQLPAIYALSDPKPRDVCPVAWCGFAMPHDHTEETTTDDR